MYLKFPFRINSFKHRASGKICLLASVFFMITWDGKPKTQNLPSGHLFKDMIRSSELDLILPSARLWICYISNYAYSIKLLLSVFIHLFKQRQALRTGLNGKAKSHFSPYQGQTFCLHVTYHTLPLRPDQRGRLIVTSAHALPATPPPPYPAATHQKGFLGGAGEHSKLKSPAWTGCCLLAFASLPHLTCKHLGKNSLCFKWQIGTAWPTITHAVWYSTPPPQPFWERDSMCYYSPQSGSQWRQQLLHQSSEKFMVRGTGPVPRECLVCSGRYIYYLLSKCSLSTYYGPDTVLGAQCKVTDKTGRNSLPHGTNILVINKETPSAHS